MMFFICSDIRTTTLVLCGDVIRRNYCVRIIYLLISTNKGNSNSDSNTNLVPFQKNTYIEDFGGQTHKIGGDCFWGWRPLIFMVKVSCNKAHAEARRPCVLHPAWTPKAARSGAKPWPQMHRIGPLLAIQLTLQRTCGKLVNGHLQKFEEKLGN